MKQKIYKLKSNTLSRFLIGIACRNQHDSIAGLFVNTDPYDSIMCRETEFQAKKICSRNSKIHKKLERR